MAKCKDCLHCEICAKQNRLVQIDAHTWDEYELLDDVEKFCEHFKNTADVVPRAELDRVARELERVEALYFAKDTQLENAKAEVAREIFEEIEAKICEKLPMKIFSCIDGKPFAGNETSVGRERALYEVLALVLELKKKRTESKDDKQ